MKKKDTCFTLLIGDMQNKNVTRINAYVIGFENITVVTYLNTIY
jgi:hypothetical protein